MAAMPHEGLFVWHDLITGDLAAAREFYTALYGWDVKPEDMGGGHTYDMIKTAGREIGGMIHMDPAHGVPTHWMSYVLVADAQATVDAAQRLGGGIVRPVAPIPNVGCFAVLRDPQGATFAVFQPDMTGAPPPDEGLPEGPGTFCWHELLAQDADRAAPFYVGLFGWTHATQEMGEFGTYHLFRRGEDMVAGMLPMPADAPGPSAWLPYVFVEDLEDAVAHTTRLGGAVCVPPTAVPEVGRFAVVSDRQGATIAHFSA